MSTETARRQGEWTAVRVADGTHPWLIKREGRWPSEFQSDADVADWDEVEISSGEAAGFHTFAAQFAQSGR